MYDVLYDASYRTTGDSVQRLKPTRDIQPVSEFRANAAKFIDQVRETKQPVIITQHGRGAAVLVDIESFEELVDELRVLRSLDRSQADEAAGRVMSHEAVMQDVRARYGD